MIEEALSHLVKGIVDHPDDVSVEQRAPRGNRNDRRGAALEVRVNPEDLGRVIGRNGRTAKALRTVIVALGGQNVRVDLVDTDGGKSRPVRTNEPEFESLED